MGILKKLFSRNKPKPWIEEVTFNKIYYYADSEHAITAGVAEYGDGWMPWVVLPGLLGMRYYPKCTKMPKEEATELASVLALAHEQIFNVSMKYLKTPDDNA